MNLPYACTFSLYVVCIVIYSDHDNESTGHVHVCIGLELVIYGGKVTVRLLSYSLVTQGAALSRFNFPVVLWWGRRAALNQRPEMCFNSKN